MHSGKVMKELKYVEKLRQDDSLLSMPQSLSQILTMVGKDDFSMDDLSEVILKDPGLTSKILKMANSAFYRQRSQISTVKQAVVMLGMMQVKCLALSASVFQTGHLQDKYHIDMKELFSHFISVALGCNMLVDYFDIKSGEEKFELGKRALELLGVEHEVTIENVVLSKEDSKALLINLCDVFLSGDEG